MLDLRPAAANDLDEMTSFLRDADLTVSGLDAASVRLWMSRDDDGRIVATTGFEVGDGGGDVLIRSVAVREERQRGGIGAELARFALDRARDEGATTAWLFSRRSGPFWQKLGFVAADLDAIAVALASTSQVQLFRQTGQLQREVAWRKAL